MGTVISPDERGRDAVGGPRQPKPLKRRPLPADPTSTDSPPHRPLLPDHSQSSPLPYTAPLLKDPGYGPDPRFTHGSLTIGGQQIPDRQSSFVDYETQGISSVYSAHLYPSQPYNDCSNPTFTPEYDASTRPEQNTLSHKDYRPENIVGRQERMEPPQGRLYPERQPAWSAGYEESSPYMTSTPHADPYQKLDLPMLPPYEPRDVELPAQTVSGGNVYGSSYSNSLPQHQSTLSTRPEPYSYVSSPAFAGTYPTKDTLYQESPLRHHVQSQGRSADLEIQQQTPHDEEPPPPPPVHRSSGLRPQTQRDEHNMLENYNSISVPSPLNFRPSRASASASPLSQSYTTSIADEYAPSASPSNAELSSKSAISISSHTSYGQPGRRQSHEPLNFSPGNQHVQPTPPSLVPGYDPSIVEDESERILRERRMSARPSQGSGLAASYEKPPVYDTPPRMSPLAQAEGQATPYPVSYGADQRVHRASAPLVKPRAISPDPRTPVRKSVSPQPESAPAERRLSGVPFSPDSYDSLNPNVNSASSINKPGAKYNTPEQAKNAYQEREKEAKLDEGPIIGNDGRVIDPSDHLPTETWAPEPERKNPRKGPEITFRFRHNLQGAQPMPEPGRRPPRQTVIRPQVVTTPIHADPNDSTSPTSATRNRLQKKSRAAPAQPNSSPIVPTLNTTPRSLPKSSASEYPLREHINYGHGNSPTYARSSPTAPPPIPAKMPLARGQEDWGVDALSEEMRRIDIGVGGGSGVGRARRSRFGP